MVIHKFSEIRRYFISTAPVAASGISSFPEEIPKVTNTTYLYFSTPGSDVTTHFCRQFSPGMKFSTLYGSPNLQAKPLSIATANQSS